jgi:hypothetical protein
MLQLLVVVAMHGQLLPKKEAMDAPVCRRTEIH